MWLPDSLHNVAEATATTSPGTASHPPARLFRHRDSIMSMHSADAPSAAVPLICMSSPPSPLARAECLRASESESFDTGNLNNVGGSRASTPRLCCDRKQAIRATSTTPPSRLRRSASLPTTRCNGSHIFSARLSTPSAAGGAGGGTGSCSSPTPLSERSGKQSSTSTPQLLTVATPLLQRAPHAQDTARAKGGDTSHDGGGAQFSNAPDGRDPTPYTAGASANSSPTAARSSPPLLPSYTLPVTDNTHCQDNVLAGDMGDTTAVVTPARKRKKKKNKKKKSGAAVASSAVEEEDAAMPAEAIASTAGGTGTPIGGSTTVNSAVPATGSLPPPPIPMMPGGGGNSSGVAHGALLGPGYSQGHGSGGGGSLLYNNLSQPQFHPQHLGGARGQFVMMANGAQGGNGAGDPIMTGYSMNGGASGTDDGGGDYTSAATAVCAGGEGSTYGRGGSAMMMMSMMASNYHHHHHHHIRHESSGSGGTYGYYHGGMSDCGRGGAAGMSPAHAQMSHQGVGRNLQEEQRQQQHVQQQQTPYPYPPQPVLMSSGGSTGSGSYPANSGHTRHGSAHRRGGGSSGGTQCSSQSQQQYQQQQYYYQNLRYNSQPYFHGGVPSTNGADANAMQGGLIMATGEGSSCAEGGGRDDCAGFSNTQGQSSGGVGGSMQYKGEDAASRVPSQVPVEGMVPVPQQPQRNVSFRPPMPAANASGMSYYPSSSAAPATVAAAAGVPNNGSVNSSYVSCGSRGGVPGAMMARDGGAAVNGEGRLPREEVMAADIAADAAPRSLFQFTPEVSPRLCRLIERELLTYLTPSLACLQRRRSQLETLAGYITAALRHAGRQTGHDYGDISYYIFGSVNMRTVLPDGDNDVTVEVDGLVARESTLTPPPSPPQPLSSSLLSDGGGGGAALDASAKAVMLPVTTDSSTGSVDGTMQLTTTTDGCPRLVAPAVLSIASGEVLGRVRDYLRSFKTPVFVDSLVMAEVRVLKLAMEGCNYDITIGQFGGVNCVRFLHEMDAVIGDQHVLKRTLLLLKAWCCYEAHILGGQAGYIGSYAATVMLISMLNTVEFLEDADAGQTESDGDGTAAAAATAAVTLESLMSGDSTAEEEEEESVLQNLASSSSAPATTAAKASTTKGAEADREGEGLLSDTTSPTSSNRGGHCHDRDSAGQPGRSPSHPAGHDTTVAPPRPLSPLTLFARFLKFYAYFDFDRYCVTAFGPLPLHKITSTPLDLSYLEVDAAHSKPLEGVAASNRAATDLSFLGLTPEGEAAIGHLVRRRQQPLLTVSGVKHLLDQVNRSRRAERQARYEARQQPAQRPEQQTDTNAAQNASEHRSTSTSSLVQLNRAGCAAEDAGLMCPSCNTAVFPVRDMNVLDPLRWSSNMVRGVCRNHLQRIQRAFLEGLRLLDVASQELGGDVMQMDVTSVGASASASRTAGGVGATGRRRAGAAAAKAAASPTSQWSAFSAASSSSRSWTDSAANGVAGQARVQQGAMNGASVYGSPGSAVETGGGGGGEVQLCPGYPAPHSQCTVRETGVLEMLFPRTIEAIRKHSHLNCPWSCEGADAAALTEVPQCPGCTKPSLLCTPAIRRMCQPQLIFHPPGTSEASNTAAKGGRQSKQLQSTSGKATSSPTSTATPQQSPSLAISPTQSKHHQGSGGRRGNAAALEQVVSELEEAFAGQDTSEEARNGGPLGEAMVPVTEQPLTRDSAVGGATGSQLPPPSSSTASASPLQGNVYGPGAVEATMHHHPHQMYSPGGACNSGGVGGAYLSAYPVMSLSASTPEEKYYTVPVSAAAGSSAGGAGSPGGYGLSPSHHGNRSMGPLSQQHQHHHYAQQQQHQHQHHAQQAHVRIGSMSSPVIQGSYSVNNGGGTGNSGQRPYATNQTVSIPMEGSGYPSYGGHNYAPAVRQQQQQQYPYQHQHQHQQHHQHRSDDGTMSHSSGNHGYKGGGSNLHNINHHSNSSSDSNAQALLLQRL
ncbi:conserved hypothetical protein [Leishmania major strain Friedlin]|uniref:PAP/OAS1 substrate-binding-related domain-containing protein n=1 Tax=Leishmania major TaxID=5664 RepID=Q4QDP4_LEIMA|nr:conserved hypothetical protein [Leishmania major strain Friedlin]CAG9572533.1 Protein_of_unknown_function_(DUF3648)_-_putative [Leishmania major strain Friedlin]CAJ04245.1 conserved hypothetical protein [Leishmania major strain Friedlin]|eukprot:XP_001682554.1 conserved hypothetical protein [Leishmania major strain Friedlin]